ncbi:diguanylate cyclase [Massilia sp. Dwa41.01b]|uniref:diguanylate cyclase n=1 Tax=Massilia sp. Dwa41.01b TaxID=2709302 RepID=UPI002804B606|nr:diguanylate cyclase [Massilia sp. Dwa41.01b]
MAPLRRAGLPVALILADIDHFKLYNDRYGHQAGDLCTEQVARAMTDAAARAQDMVARYGGEEFAILLPQVDAFGAEGVARRLLAELDALAIAHAVSPTAPVLTLSMGIAAMVPDAREASATLIRAADALLYQAKAEGRNRYRRAGATA